LDDLTYTVEYGSRTKPYSYKKQKPKGYNDISSKRYNELVQEVERDRKYEERSKSNKKRPQTAHYPIKNEFESNQKPKRKKQTMTKKSKDAEYINIVKEYEDVLSQKLKKKTSKKKAKDSFSLSSKHPGTTRSKEDPYEKFISFYPSQNRETEMFEEKYAKE
jgi:hypothetical protein